MFHLSLFLMYVCYVCKTPHSPQCASTTFNLLMSLCNKTVVLSMAETIREETIVLKNQKYSIFFALSIKYKEFQVIQHQYSR